MDVGIGLPNAVPHTTGDDLTGFARRADERGFATLGTIDRIVFDNHAPLVALAAAAAVTERIGLMTSVLLGPLRPNAATLGKQTLSLNALSGGRFTLGIAIGGREDDYEAAGVSMSERGEIIDELLEGVKRVWDDDSIGPNDAGPPRLLVGGGVEASFKRAARFGDGWISGGIPPDQYVEAVKGVRAAWSEAGRDGEPALKGLAYFALGDDGEQAAQSYLTEYYAWLGEETADMIAGSAATDPDTVQGYLQAFAEADCDELIMFPCSSDPQQADLLADAAGL